MNPLKGVARMFSAQTMVELIKTLAKASVIGTVAALVISHYRDQMISLMHTTPTEALRLEEHTSDLQSLMRTSYAVFCLHKQNNRITTQSTAPPTFNPQAYYLTNRQ